MLKINIKKDIDASDIAASIVCCFMLIGLLSFYAQKAIITKKNVEIGIPIYENTISNLNKFPIIVTIEYTLGKPSRQILIPTEGSILVENPYLYYASIKK